MSERDVSLLLIGCAVIGFGLFVLRALKGAQAQESQSSAATPLPKRSFYCLELSYDFDGGRASTELYVYRALDFILKCVTQRLLPRGIPALEHILWLFSRTGGRATARVHVFVGGQHTAVASLVEHLRARADGEASRLDVDRSPEESERLARRAELELDWAAIAASLPALTGDLLQPGEAAECVLPAELLAVWADDDEPAVVHYGFQDLHYPDSPASEPLDDPDPPPSQ